MDQIARNNFDASLYFDKVAPAPRRVFHNLAKQSDVLPKLVLLHPPELSPSYFRGQRKPINIFKKLVPKLGTSLHQKFGCKRRGRHGDSGMKERSEQKPGYWNVEWSVTPPSSSIIPSDAPAFEQALSVESSPSSSVYSPQSALIEALGLAFDHVSAIEPLSYSEGVQRVKFSCSNVKPTRSQARVLRRKSCHPHPMLLSPPPQQRSQASPAPSKKVYGGTPGHSFRRPPSSSRRTSRSLMFGHNPKKPTFTYQRQSNFSSLSGIIQAAETDKPLTGIHRRRRPSSRRIHAPKPASKFPLAAKLILPPMEIHPLTIYPFLTEFSDHASSVRGNSNSAPSTPSLTTPPSDIASLASISSQKDIRGQKILKRYGRCPSDFLDLGLTNPIHWPNIEQAGTDIVLDPPTSTPPPRFDSLRGYSRASLEKAMEITEETKSVPSKASLRPKLTLQIPKSSGPSRRTVIHRPVATIRHCKQA